MHNLVSYKNFQKKKTKKQKTKLPTILVTKEIQKKHENPMSINPEEDILEVAFFSYHQQDLSSLLLLLWADFSPTPRSHETTTVAPISNLVPWTGLSLRGTSDSFTTLYKIPQ